MLNLGNEYGFKHSFERIEPFEALQKSYKGDVYRFDDSADESAAVREELAEAYYEVEIGEHLEPLCVVEDHSTDHAANLRS